MTPEAPKNLLYIFTVSQSHPGLKIKFQGQLDGFQSLVKTVKALAIPVREEDSLWKKIVKTLYFQCIAIRYILWSPFTTIYIRYNPKTPALLVAACLIAPIKTVWIEHNINYDNELPLLNRLWEWRLHKLCTWLFTHTAAHHVGVSPEITRHLEDSGLRRTATIQNGYTPPKPSAPPNKAIISQVKNFILPDHHVAIMVTNGYRWHGVEEILLLTAPFPMQVIIAGPYPNLTATSTCLPLGQTSPETLQEIYTLCDFGIGTFRMDMLGLTQGSPLKTREYLCHGLPILVNYHDSAQDIPELAPYVFNYAENTTAIYDIYATPCHHDTLKKIANEHLNWATQLRPLLLKTINLS